MTCHSQIWTGAPMLAPVRESLAADTALHWQRVARDAQFWSPQTAPRPPMSAELLARGQERFDIFCAPCHGRTGNGDGMVVQRGMPSPRASISRAFARRPAGTSCR